MEPGDLLDDVAKYVFWQRNQAMNAMEKKISEEAAAQAHLPFFRRTLQTGMSPSLPSKLPGKEGGDFTAQLVSQNTVKRFNSLKILSPGLHQRLEANKLLRCLPFGKLAASTDEIIQRVLGRYSLSDIQASYKARQEYSINGDPDGSLGKIMVWILSYLFSPIYLLILTY